MRVARGTRKRLISAARPTWPRPLIAGLCLTVLGTTLLTACAAPDAHRDMAVSPKDGARLHYVPAGTLMMGNDDGWAGQKPVHGVRLEAFWIDETEVTNRMYALCVRAGHCAAPEDASSYTREGYYLDPQYSDFPVVHVAWQSADTYCAWAGRRLPSEAEWEMAARGTDGRLYPWGDQAPDGELLNNFNVSYREDTAQVGSYPQGASPYGALDMAGNVWEWTADWFDAYPGGDVTASEHYGQTYKVLRGGSFVDAADATTRYPNDPELQTHDIGFRCVSAAPRNAN